MSEVEIVAAAHKSAELCAGLSHSCCKRRRSLHSDKSNATGGELIAVGIKIRIDMDKVPKAGRPEIPTLLPHGRKHRRVLGRLAIGVVLQIHRGPVTLAPPEPLRISSSRFSRFNLWMLAPEKLIS